MFSKRFYSIPLFTFLLFFVVYSFMGNSLIFGQVSTPRPRPTGQATPRPRPTGQTTPRPRPTGQTTPRPRPTGQTTPRPRPTGQVTPGPRPTPGTPGIVTPKLAAGWSHSIGLDSNGDIFCWGLNDSGQLGDGTNNDSLTPVAVIASDLTTFVDIAAGGDHSMALDSESKVWVWGFNGSGELGIGTTDESNIPVSISNLSDVVAIACGSDHSLAVKSDGTLWAWGDNLYGQLGVGSDISMSTTPIQVSSLSGVIGIAAGDEHSLALLSDGTVWAWGGNDEGQLGDGTKNVSYTPLQVSDISDIKAVAAGEEFSLALGSLWAWGYNDEGELGNDSTVQSSTPVKVLIKNVTAIACGAIHSLAIKENGNVQAWGDNSEGQLGDGTFKKSTIPQKVQGISDIVFVACGDFHSLALNQDGTVYVWGLNEDGQLGTGNTANSNIPTAIDLNLGVTEVEPTPTPSGTPQECIPDKLKSSERKLKMKTSTSEDVTIQLTGEGGCAIEGEAVTTKVNRSGRNSISITPQAGLVTDENGEATFTVIASEEAGRAKIKIKSGGKKKKIKVKVQE